MELSKISLIIAIILSLAVIIVPSLGSVSALTKINFVGDIGCRNESISILENLGESNIPLVGLGDYMYGCNPGDDVDAKGGDTLGDLYAEIEQKVGAEGNHEAVKHQQEAWARDTFKYPNDFAAWRLRDVGIIILNPYVDFEKGSDQYNFVDRKAKEFDARPGINWIVFAVHEDLWTPTVIGGHGPNEDLRDAYEPIIKRSDKSILVQAHNHIIAVGTVSDINQMVCGGGGYAGDDLGKLSGWEWATDDTGTCLAEFDPNAVNVTVLDTDSNVLRNQIFRK